MTDFTGTCPVCKGPMPEGNLFCSLNCHDNQEEEEEDNEPVRSWET